MPTLDCEVVTMKEQQHIDKRMERIRKIKAKRRNKNLLFIIQVALIALLWVGNSRISIYTNSVIEEVPTTEAPIEEVPIEE